MLLILAPFLGILTSTTNTLPLNGAPVTVKNDPTTVVPGMSHEVLVDYVISYQILHGYMSKKCLSDFDMYLSMNFQQQWESYHNKQMKLETYKQLGEMFGKDRKLLTSTVRIPPM